MFKGMLKKRILLLAMTLFLLLALTSCAALQPKTPLTEDQFKTLMEDNGLTIVDATDQFEKGHVDIVLIACSDHFQIEFYVVSTVEQAENAFQANKQDFEDISGSATTGSLNGSNYNAYSKTTDDGFYVISRIDNTFVYVDEDVDYKEDIKALLIKMGY